MNKNLITLIFCIVPFLGFSQNETSRKYYSDKSAQNETKNKGKYLLVETLVSDSIVHKEFTNSKSGAKLWIKEYLNGKPYGTWIEYNKDGQVSREFSYRFILRYGKQVPEGYLAIDYKAKKLESQLGGNFVMPKLQNQDNGFGEFIRNNIQYPIFAQENGIQGVIFMQFTIDRNGKVGNISIIRGVHESLDREAFRLIHSAGDWTPAMLNGEGIDTYIVFPITFNMQ